MSPHLLAGLVHACGSLRCYVHPLAECAQGMRLQPDRRNTRTARAAAGRHASASGKSCADKSALALSSAWPSSLFCWRKVGLLAVAMPQRSLYKQQEKVFGDVVVSMHDVVKGLLGHSLIPLLRNYLYHNESPEHCFPPSKLLMRLCLFFSFQSMPSQDVNKASGRSQIST